MTKGLYLMIKNSMKNTPANFFVNWVCSFKDMALSSFDKKTTLLDLLPKLPWSKIALKLPKIDIFGYFLLCWKIWVCALNNFLSGVLIYVLDLLPILTKIPLSKCPIFGLFCTPFFECVRMKELFETSSTLFTELKNLDPLSRYHLSTVAKMAVFYS